MAVIIFCGKLLWQETCKPLHVSHSKYFHKATVTVQNQTITVDSVGSYGEFVEALDLDSGKQLSRSLVPPK